MIVLRDYQERAIQHTRMAFRTGANRVLIVAPTSAGKTKIASRIAKLHNSTPGKHVVWVTHRTELVDQTIRSLLDEGLRVATFGDTRTPPNPHVTVGMVQTMLARQGKWPKATFLIMDECFPSGTIVDGKPIESISRGDYVSSFDSHGRIHFNKVLRTFKSRPSGIVVLHTKNGSLACTPNHKMWTRDGWEQAVNCCGKEVMYAASKASEKSMHSTMFMVRNKCGGFRKERTGAAEERVSILLSGACEIDEKKNLIANHGSYQQKICHSIQRCQGENDGRGTPFHERSPQGDRASADMSWRKWQTTTSCAIKTCERIGVEHGSCRKDILKEPWIPVVLQDRHCQYGSYDCDRSRRTKPRDEIQERAGREEVEIPEFIRVDRVEVLKPTSDGTFGGVCPDGFVYNIEVECTHSYFANGFGVSNCHHYAADEYSGIIVYYAGIPGIGLTATPERPDGRGMGSSMAGVKLFDRIVQVETVKNLTKAGALVPYVLMAPKQGLKPGCIAQHPIDAYVTHANGTKAILFARDVSTAEQYCQEANARGILSAVVHGKMPYESRRIALEQHRRGLVKILVNVYVLTEGYDDPSIETLILARSCGSVGLYLQMVGRVLRPSPGKTRALILDLAGVTHVFGEPNADREWSLDGKAIRGGDNTDYRFCPRCGFPIDVGSTCGQCGYEPEVKDLTPEVTGEALVKYAAKREEDNEERAKTLARWMKNSMNLGHKQGAALHKFHAVYGEWPTHEVKKRAVSLMSES